MTYIFKGGTIVDGTGGKPYKSTVIVKGQNIVDIIKEDGMYEGEVIDITGKIIAPGFIDIHSHSDTSYFLPYKTLSKIYQGITTEIVGNCGISLIPSLGRNEEGLKKYLGSILELDLGEGRTLPQNMKEYIDLMDISNPAANIGVLIGHGTLRGSIMGFDDRKPSKEEIKEMSNLLDEQLKDGAFGLSLGLIYSPGSFADIKELIELAKVVKDNNGILSVHLRNEGAGVFEAIDEMIHIGKLTGVHIHISHLKLIGKKQWGKSESLLDKIRKAKKEGVNITCDQYPYTATSTGLSALVPKWAQDGGSNKMVERLNYKNSVLDKEIEDEMENRGGSSSIFITDTKGYMKEIESMNIEEISRLLNLEPVEAIKRIMITCKDGVTAAYHSLDHRDILNIMKEKYISVGSDGSALSLDSEYTYTNPHPRNFGTFPKFIETIREHNIMPIEEGIYKMTKLNAEILGIKDRGVLEIGKVADLVVLDYEKVQDQSTFMNSRKHPVGIEYVFINGEPTLYNGEEKNIGKGKIILK